MAEAIDRKQIRALPIERPSRVRGRLRSGDLLFASGIDGDVSPVARIF